MVDTEKTTPQKLIVFSLVSVTVSNLELRSVLDLELGSKFGLGLGSVLCVLLIEIAVNQKKTKDGQFVGVLFSK